MANKQLFNTRQASRIELTDAINEAGGVAYALSSRHALAQYAATGCLTGTYYADATDQLETVLDLAEDVPTEFIARTAVYARERAFMKDMPALLCAVLAVHDGRRLARVFDRVIDDGRMLRSFVQIVRSGSLARRSLGTRPKRLVARWLEGRSDEALFRASVGNAPSLADVIKLAHPKPRDAVRQALYGYLLDRPHDADMLPGVVRDFEAFKSGRTKSVPDVPFQMLTALKLDTAAWTAIAARSSWQTTRMNLNTFARHGVFDQQGLPAMIAERLRDPEQIARARVLPYQLMMAALAASDDVPAEVRAALTDAMEIALANVPALPGKVYVCCDVSGSMQSPVTGHRPGATTAVRCVDVAALIAAAVVRKNPDAEVLPFDESVKMVRLAAHQPVLANAAVLASLGGGGTACSAPLAMLNARGARGELVIFVSDNESWVDRSRAGGTAVMREWSHFRRRNPGARMVCIDLVPNRTTQACEGADVLNVGGFSDAVFQLLDTFARGGSGANHWVDVIEATEL